MNGHGSWRVFGLAAATAAALSWGCQSQSSNTASGGNEHPTGKSPSTRSEHPTGRKTAPSDHPTGSGTAPARSEHPTGRSTAPTQPAAGTAKSPASGDPACLLPPEPQDDAVDGIAVGKVLPAFETTDVVTGKTVRTADFKGRYLLIHYWASW